MDTHARLAELRLLRAVRDRIDRDYARSLSVEALAAAVHMSAGHLRCRLRRAAVQLPHDQAGGALLPRRGDGVTEACFAVGFSSLGTFSTRFSELVGMSPSAYRRQAAQATAGVPTCVVSRATRPVRNREARHGEPA